MTKAKAKTTPANTIAVGRDALVASLAKIAKIIESRNTYPILANVHLHTADDRLHLRGTDLDIEISTSIPCSGALNPTTAPAKTLHDIARKMAAGSEITLSHAEENLAVSSGRSRFHLATLSADAFPTLAAQDMLSALDIDLAALMAPVTFAISNEATRYYLNGVFLHDTGKETRAVATDGHRLGRHAIQAVGLAGSYIVPTKTVGVIPEGVVSVSFTDTRMRIVAGETTIVSKLIEGTYPDYERVTPKNNDRLLTVDKAALGAAVDRVSIVASERGGRAVKLELAAGTLKLSVRNDADAGSEELECDYSGEPMEIGFNARYVSEMLANVAGDKVTFAFGDSGGPALVTGVDDSCVFVLMPMRV